MVFKKGGRKIIMNGNDKKRFWRWWKIENTWGCSSRKTTVGRTHEEGP